MISPMNQLLKNLWVVFFTLLFFSGIASPCISEPVILDLSKSVKVELGDAGTAVILSSSEAMPQIQKITTSDGKDFSGLKAENLMAQESSSTPLSDSLFDRAKQKYQEHLGAKKIGLRLTSNNDPQVKFPLELYLTVQVGAQSYRVVLVYPGNHNGMKLQKRGGCSEAKITNL